MKRLFRSVFSSEPGSKYDCSTAASFDEAMLLASESFALVITDLIMPAAVELNCQGNHSSFLIRLLLWLQVLIDSQRLSMPSGWVAIQTYLIKRCDHDFWT